MRIITDHITLNELRKFVGTFFADMVKGVVDIERRVLAIDAEMHADLEGLLLNDGATQTSLWGINLYPENDGDSFIEFDSLINIRPAQNNRSRGVEDQNLQQQIIAIVNERIVR